MNLKKTERKAVKLRLGISGASGFGKTYSSLKLALGMTNDWSKIAVIDSENSASLYSHLGDFFVLDLKEPFSPERFISAIEVCENAEIEVLIIDSLSKEWQGTGGCLQIHEQLGGRFQDWVPVKKRHQKLLDKLLSSKCHIITTTRRKTDYSLDIGNNGKTKVVKHGTKEIISDGYEYELSVSFEIINENHSVKVSKDRTELFSKKGEFIITEETGRALIEWCNSGTSIEDVKMKISKAQSLSELKILFNNYKSWYEYLENEFTTRKTQIELLNKQPKHTQNGAATI